MRGHMPFARWKALALRAARRHRLHWLWRRLVQFSPVFKRLYCGRDACSLFTIRMLDSVHWTEEERREADRIALALPIMPRQRDDRFSPEGYAKMVGRPPWLADLDCGTCDWCTGTIESEEDACSLTTP